MHLQISICVFGLALLHSAPHATSGAMSSAILHDQSRPNSDNGDCSFYAQIRQRCVHDFNYNWVISTTLQIPTILDSNQNTIVKPADGHAVALLNTKTWGIEGLENSFGAIWYEKLGERPKLGTFNVIYEDHCVWYPDERKSCGGCGWGDWTRGL